MQVRHYRRGAHTPTRPFAVERDGLYARAMSEAYAGFWFEDLRGRQ